MFCLVSRSVEGCLVEEKMKVERLLTYVGVSTVDDLTNETLGVTWQQERDQLQQENQVCDNGGLE